jgi:hypothetical protein
LSSADDTISASEFSRRRSSSMNGPSADSGARGEVDDAERAARAVGVWNFAEIVHGVSTNPGVRTAASP